MADIADAQQQTAVQPSSRENGLIFLGDFSLRASSRPAKGSESAPAQKKYGRGYASNRREIVAIAETRDVTRISVAKQIAVR